MSIKYQKMIFEMSLVPRVKIIEIPIPTDNQWSNRVLVNADSWANVSHRLCYPEGFLDII